MTPLEDALAAAAALIEEALPQLDASSNVCDCCGVTKYASFPEALLHRELKAIALKLRRMAASDAAARRTPEPQKLGETPL